MKKVASIYILVFLVSCNNAQEDSTRLEMHRTQDTTKHSSGLYFAESTLGNFSVLTPLPFNR